MIESILLDILLVLVLVLLASIGAYRGGLREAFSAAGVVLGALLASEWDDRWGEWLSENTSLSDGGARFLVSVGLLVVSTALVGYGVGASFNYHPGPGGRMFGAALGVASALVAVAYVLTWLREDLFGGDEPEVVAESVLARLLDNGAGTILLVASAGVIFGAIFGSFVRERDDDVVEMPHTRSFAAVNAPDKIEPVQTARHSSAPVRVQQSRRWDDRAGEVPATADRQWSNTWPSDAPGIRQEERAPRQSEVQQARERRRSQRRDGSGRAEENGGSR
ncbi:MAG: CvpA family protein [Chloroflexota bacterium]|nr:CvpA family protein [Chloroflexota bacterium]